MKNLICICGIILSVLCGADVKKEVYYKDFGAKGDGKTDDLKAIVAAHEYANTHSLPVKATDGATYYIGGIDDTAIIQTDTDFGTANFIIDDRNVKNRNQSIFKITSKMPSYQISDIQTLKMDQASIALSLPYSALIAVENKNKRNYIRFGANANKGVLLTDIFIIDKTGNVDPQNPILWNFDEVTLATVYPIDKEILTISGGVFITIANSEVGETHFYYRRNIDINRSNTVINGVQHYIKNEGENGFAYNGFIYIHDCANILVKNCIFTGHKVYYREKDAYKRVPQGSYDFHATRALNVTFLNSKQSNDIKDSTYWGIMGSSFSKNLTFDGCEFSRFDAHMGVVNATIRNTKLGYPGITIIGKGELLVENTEIFGWQFITLRQDYGSSWQGNITIKNCKLTPPENQKATKILNLIKGDNYGQHDFGYPCYQPERILIENLTISDKNYDENYQGVDVLGNFNPKKISSEYEEKHSIKPTKELIIKNLKVESGKCRPFSNLVLYKDIKVIYQ